MATAKEYNSPYERLVLTGTHPAKATFMKLDDPPYIASQRFPWLAIRREEAVVVGFMATVFVYCASVYTGLYVITTPFRLVLGYSWDLFIASMVALRIVGRLSPRLPSRKAIAAMPPAEQEVAQGKKKAAANAYTKRRNAAFALCAVGAVVRWHYGWGDVRSLMA